MSDSRDDQEHRTFPAVWPVVLLILVLMVAYPLSIGPLAWLCENGYVDADNPIWTAVYTPLGWLMEQSEWYAKVVYGYVRWWTP